MTTSPTKAQRAGLALLAAGDAHRSARAFASSVIYATGGRITAATAAALVRHGWAEWGPEAGLRKPLLITDAGRAFLSSGSETATKED